MQELPKINALNRQTGETQIRPRQRRESFIAPIREKAFQEMNGSLKPNDSLNSLADLDKFPSSCPERPPSRLTLSPIKISPDNDKTDASRSRLTSPSFSPFRPGTPRGATPLDYRSRSRNAFTPTMILSSLTNPEDTYTSLKNEFSALIEALKAPTLPTTLVDRYKLAFEINDLQERVYILEQKASFLDDDVRTLRAEIDSCAKQHGCRAVAMRRIQEKQRGKQEIFIGQPSLVEQKLLLAESFLKASEQALEVNEEIRYLQEDEKTLSKKIKNFKKIIADYGPEIGIDLKAIKSISDAMDNPEIREKTADQIREDFMLYRRDPHPGFEAIYIAAIKILGSIDDIKERIESIEASHKILQDSLVAIPAAERKLLVRDLAGNRTPDALAKDILRSPEDCSWQDASHVTAHTVCFKRAKQEFASSANLYRSSSASPSPFASPSPLPPIIS